MHALTQHIELTCLVCYERITDSPVYLHRCKHAFCSECFRQSVQAQVSQGKIKIASKCPQCLENNVSNEILKKVLSLNEYQRIVGLQLKQIKPESAEEVLKQCPRCDYGEFIHP